VTRAHRARKDPLEPTAHRAQRADKGLLEQLARREIGVCKASRATPVQLVQLGLAAQRERLVRPGLLEQPVPPALPAPRECKDRRVPPVLKV
jgi:hypothetical protein